ncbi:uncharacterized protein LY79DRAFT_401054 [Colletotrichum navitas]|uniref:Uncharacterized protein n=1 Tax=Colletotrichum navitas TaxID=681940 RepID=A0AAD8PQ28_9PEZI|nr:uncharacterized protein LY79DRAFT_401054 [Colletotrichum navitas]KAK1573679.1 hypothetical protein LY79DRAFT_401054 [Colletotrichum navitas]
MRGNEHEDRGHDSLRRRSKMVVAGSLAIHTVGFFFFFFFPSFFQGLIRAGKMLSAYEVRAGMAGILLTYAASLSTHYFSNRGLVHSYVPASRFGTSKANRSKERRQTEITET